MGPQPMGKVPDLRRLAGRVAPRSTVPWSWPCRSAQTLRPCARFQASSPPRRRPVSASSPRPRAAQYVSGLRYELLTAFPGRAGKRHQPFSDVRPETGSVRPGPRSGNHGGGN